MGSENRKSYSTILHSTSIIGIASFLNIFINLIRIKVAALILGPAGIGLIGIFSNLISLGSTVVAIGSGTVGTRQIAEAAGREDEVAVEKARQALMWGTLLLAILGGGLFWSLRGVIASYALHDAEMYVDVGWLAVSVALIVYSGAQSALLNGLQRIKDLAKVSVYSALLSTVAGIGVLLIWREEGLIPYLLLTPIASFAVGKWYLARIPKIVAPKVTLPEVAHQWKLIARLGLAFMLAGLVVMLGQLTVRTIIQSQLGASALGLFEASWVISMTYIGFVLRAMGTDYYPRLTAIIHDKQAANKLINEQTEIALMLLGPVLLAIMGLLPWVVELIYSSKFAGAVNILRWQIMGDVLKVASYPLGFALLAGGEGRKFFISDTAGMIIFALVTWLCLPYLGLQSAGIGFLSMYLVYLPIVYWSAKARTDFAWSSRSLFLLTSLMVSCAVVVVATKISVVVPVYLGVGFSVIFTFYSVSRLRKDVQAISAYEIKLRKLIGKCG